MKTKNIILSLLIGTSAWAGPITIQKSVVTNEDQTTQERLVLGDAKGLSLYTFTPDKANESTCYEACAKAWPPVIVTAEEVKQAAGVLGTTVRKDGSLQLTVDSRPVYLFAGDQAPGDINGEGLGGVWFLLDVKITK